MRSFFQVSCLCLAACVLLPACQSNQKLKFQTHPRSMTLTSEPSGATVTQIMPYTNSRTVIGQTPMTDQRVMVLSEAKGSGMSPNRMSQLLAQLGSARLEFSKPGYLPVVGNYSGHQDPDQTATHRVVLEPKDPERVKEQDTASFD